MSSGSSRRRMVGIGSNGPRQIYDRIAGVHDLYSAPMEWMDGRRRRRRLFSRARGEILEVGVGTGHDLTYYPEGVQLTGIDISPGMAARARRRADTSPADVTLLAAAVERLPFADDRFDMACATFVFCSVADPVRGLRELRRVGTPEGGVLLLEHVRPRNPVLGLLTDLISPLPRWAVRSRDRPSDRTPCPGRELSSVPREGI